MNDRAGAVGEPLPHPSPFRSNRRATVNRRTTFHLAASLAIVTWCGPLLAIQAEVPTPAPLVLTEDEAAVAGGPLLLEGPISDTPIASQALPAPIPGQETIISDVPLAAPPAELVEVSPRAADALRIDDFALDEMPRRAARR